LPAVLSVVHPARRTRPSSRKSDQTAPPTGKRHRSQQRPAPDPDPRAQSGRYLTTAQGLRLPDTDHSLKVGARGPTLLEDFHLREKITHFDHERIPEWMVHARGAAADGIFESDGTAAWVTRPDSSVRRARKPMFSLAFRLSWVHGVGRHRP
jgi:catalase